MAVCQALATRAHRPRSGELRYLGEELRHLDTTARVIIIHMETPLKGIDHLPT